MTIVNIMVLVFLQRPVENEEENWVEIEEVPGLTPPPRRRQARQISSPTADIVTSTPTAPAVSRPRAKRAIMVDFIDDTDKMESFTKKRKMNGKSAGRVVCDLCDKTYSRQDCLKRHIANIHKTK